MNILSQHLKQIPNETVVKVIENLNEVKTLLEPYCPTLTVEERHKLPKMSDANLSFGADALTHAVNHPEFLPSYLNINEWETDMTNVFESKRIAVVIDDINQMISDLRMLSGSEAYHAARALYHSVQRAAADGVAGAKPIYDDLRPNFTNRVNRTKPQQPQQ